MTHFQNKTKKFLPKSLQPLLIVGLFVGLGTLTILTSHAATGNVPPVLNLNTTTSTISWASDVNATGFMGATSNGPRSDSGRTTTYQELGNVTSWSPTAMCGQTMYYGVASEGTVSGQWSPSEVSITWPACSANGTLRVGADNISGRNYVAGLVNDFKGARVTWDRIDVGDGTDLTPISNSLNFGIKAIVLYAPGNNGGMPGIAPATTASQVKSIAQRILPMGLNEIEFGNEVYYNGSTPQSYAAQYDAAHQALAGMGIKLIACSFGDYFSASANKWMQDGSGSGWIHDFIAALPGGAAEVDGWSIHPYGSMTQIASGDDGGWPMVPRLHDLAVQYGSNAPWYVTEVGQILNGTDAVTQQQQADDLTQYLDDSLTKYPWITFWSWYEVADDNTGPNGSVAQWGLIDIAETNGWQVTNLRPSFNALKSWLAAHPDIDSSTPAAVTGDLNNDGHVNVFDLSILLSHWNQSGSSVAGDLNNDTTVNIFDLSILLSHYGS